MQVDPNYIQGLVGSLGSISATEQQLTSELSSGLGVTTLASNPIAVGQSTLLSASINRADAYVQASVSAQSRMQVADSALGEVVSQLTTAITVATGAANGTTNSSNLQAAGAQIAGIRDQVLSLANTQYLGQHIFAGSEGSVPPFAQDNSTTPATTTYTGDTALAYTTTESGQKIQTNLPGSQVFGSSASSVFGALNQLVNDLSSGASSATLASDTGLLSSALSGVINQRSILDNSLTQLQSTSTYAQSNEAQLAATECGLVSADTAAVATQLSQAELQGQALMSTFATLEKNSLFDYLR
jgi:flagellar hook-associated protein 3 FlgL